MLSKIAGMIMMLVALLWIFKPEKLKSRLLRKMDRNLKFIVYGFIIFFFFLIIGSIIRADGLLTKAVGITALLLTTKILIMITSKSTEKMSEWLSGKSLIFFRMWALSFFGMGTMLFLSAR